MRKVFLLGLLMMVTACTSANHLDAAIMSYEYVGNQKFGDRTYEVFRSKKQPDFYRAAILQDFFCCTADPIYFVNNVKAIEAVTGCEIDNTFITHTGLVSQARVICPVE